LYFSRSLGLIIWLFVTYLSLDLGAYSYKLSS
jgi:hypothetical protein